MKHIISKSEKVNGGLLPLTFLHSSKNYKIRLQIPIPVGTTSTFGVCMRELAI